MEIIKKIKYDSKDVQTKLASKIASLEIQLANEQAAKKSIIKYAEELEGKLKEEKECKSKSEVLTQDTKLEK